MPHPRIDVGLYEWHTARGESAPRGLSGLTEVNYMENTIAPEHEKDNITQLVGTPIPISIKRKYFMNTMLYKPHVLMISEITADGKLTLRRGASSKILMKHMSREAEILLHETRAEYDAIMVGSSTIRIDNSYLTVRMVPGKNPLRVIPSSMADISPDANVLDTATAPTVVAVSKRAPEDRVAALAKKGVSIVVAGEDKVDLPLLMDALYREFGVRKLIIEGGPTLNWHMLHCHMVDEIRLIHLPFIVGGDDTPSLVGGMHIDSEDQMIRLELKATRMAGANLVTEYTVRY